eukprot:TRINITY_DN109871_c0_g1_i1.p1 TRINITY_DN109871_c0_g1~~TRINITY_DN109871_c0_g1_i1.p1  ORF type:complete len:984 (-),score=200.67 TRINITY_DN109871_c0_g1_i1:86-3037(-)
MHVSPARWRDVRLPGVLSGAASSAGSVLFGAASRAEGVAPTGQLEPGRREELQSERREAEEALERLEQERDLAELTLQRWETRLATKETECACLEQQLQDLEQRCLTEMESSRENGPAQLPRQHQMLLERQRALEHIQARSKDLDRALQTSAEDHEQLRDRCKWLKNAKEKLQERITCASTEKATAEDELESVRRETLQLQQAEGEVRAKAKADIDVLEAKLRHRNKQNVELSQKLQHNEVQFHRTVQVFQNLNQQMEELAAQREQLQNQLGSGTEPCRDRLQDRERLQGLVRALRQSLQRAAQQNLDMQEGCQETVSNYGELDDKVYALMDQIRLSKFEVERQVQKGERKQARIDEFESQSGPLQRDFDHALEARLAAEEGARSASATLAALMGKHGRLQKSLQVALSTQERTERELRSLTAKSDAIEINIEFMNSRIDGNEEDKSAMRYQSRRLGKELVQATMDNNELNHKCLQASEKEQLVQNERAAIKAEIGFIRREDLLDESGRRVPLLIESDSELIDRLEINESLVHAQESRNPVPLLVGKMANLLELLGNAHEGDRRLGEYTSDARRRLSTYRQAHKLLWKRLEASELWKTRMLQNIVAALPSEAHDRAKCFVLRLDSLQLHARHLQILPVVIQQHKREDVIDEITLQANNLDASSVQILLELMEICPRLTRMDLRRNCLDTDSCEKLLTSASLHKKSSGSQEELTVDISDKGVPDDDPVETLAWLDESESEEACEGSEIDVFSDTGADHPHRLPMLLSKPPKSLAELAEDNCGRRSPSMASESTLSVTTARLGVSSPSEFSANSRSPSIASGTFSSPSRCPPFSRSALSFSTPDSEDSRSHTLSSPGRSWSQKGLSSGRHSSTALPLPGPRTAQSPASSHNRPSSSSPDTSTGQVGFDWGRLTQDTAKMLGQTSAVQVGFDWGRLTQDTAKMMGQTFSQKLELEQPRTQVTLPQIVSTPPRTAPAQGRLDGDIEM